MKRKCAAILIAMALTAGLISAQRPARALAQAAAEAEEKPGANEKFPAPPAEEKTVKTQHVIHVNGQDLHYTAVAGTLLLLKEDGKPKASIFYVSYSLDGADKTARPITFAFNGGPGSSSVWLHIGALGPKRVALTPDGQAVPPPYHLVDNQGTALVFTDIVFIDPVTTGFSRNAPGEDPKQFHGLEGDLAEVGDFIRLYTARYGRWASPKFLAGESYGTTRASALSLYLLEHEGIYLNGITLISSILNFETARFANGNDLPYILFLPTYTASAWYHKKLTGDLQNGDLQHAVEEARKFAGGSYKDALMKGDRLTEAERKDMAQQVARFTGLPAEYVDQANLRVSASRFRKELMRNERKTIGRYDTRLEGVDENAAGEQPDYDPSYAAVQGAFTAAFNEYVRTELNWQTDMPYEVLTGKVQPWNYSDFTNQYVDVAERLRSAMSQNQFMRVLQMNGYYDLATPFFATEYTFDHLGLAPQLRGNVSMHYCDAGHMLYLKQSCLGELHRDMHEFYRGAVK
ncbi:MAG TPA: peptidase S10 [Bryobacteraceae bacterium]|jgi:carboxypeptidase C (cathepsin A)|nr:peptidase S10 [Bryobacteraceae bacterium]